MILKLTNTLKNYRYLNFSLVLIGGLIFGYIYRNNQLNLLTTEYISWFGWSEYLFHLVIGILFSLFLFQIVKKLYSPKWPKKYEPFVKLIPCLCLIVFPIFFADYGIQYSLQIIIFFLIILSILTCLSNFKTYSNASQAIFIAAFQVSLFSIIYWQPNLSMPWVGYTDIFMARQIGSSGIYNQLASANLNQYSGSLPLIYATTHHHVIAYVIGLLGVSPQTGLFDFLINNFFAMVLFAISSFCLYLYLIKFLKLKSSIAIIGCIFFIANFYIYGIINSSEKTHALNYVFFPLVLYLFEKGIIKNSLPLIFLSGLINHFPNAFLYTYPENFIVFDIIIGSILVLRCILGYFSFSRFFVIGIMYSLGVLSLSFWLLPLIDFYINNRDSLGLSGYKDIQLHLGFGIHLPLIYPVYIGFISILGFVCLISLSFKAIISKQCNNFSIDNNTVIWIFLFLFLLFTSFGNDFIFSKLLSIKGVAFPFTRYWFRFGSGYTFVSIIVCCIGLNYFVSKTRYIDKFYYYLILSCLPLFIILIEPFLETLKIYRENGPNLYLGRNWKEIIFLENKFFLYISSLLPILTFAILKIIRKERVHSILLFALSSTISILFVVPLGLKEMVFYTFVIIMALMFYYFIKKNNGIKTSSNIELTLLLIAILSIFPYHNEAIISQKNVNGYLSLIKDKKLGPRAKKMDFSTLVYASNHMRDKIILNHINDQLTNVGLKKLSNYSKHNCSYIINKWQNYIQKKIDKGLNVNFENKTFNTYHKNIFPRRCWTKFAEVTSKETFKKYKQSNFFGTPFTKKQALSPLNESIFNVAGMTGRPEIWRWFSFYNSYLPIPQGLEAWSFPYQNAVSKNYINDLSISHIQMIKDDYKLFKKSMLAKDFKISDRMLGKNGVEHIFLQKINPIPIASFKCNKKEINYIGKNKYKCSENENTIFINDIRGNFISLNMNIKIPETLKISMASHRDWRFINLGNFKIKENPSKDFLNFSVTKGKGNLLIEFSSLPLKIGCLIFWTFINIFLFNFNREKI